MDSLFCLDFSTLYAIRDGEKAGGITNLSCIPAWVFSNGCGDNCGGGRLLTGGMSEYVEMRRYRNLLEGRCQSERHFTVLRDYPCQLLISLYPNLW